MPPAAHPMGFGDFFLRDPQRFPAAPQGEPWGDDRLVLDFVGGPYLFTGLSEQQRQRASDRFRPLVRNAADGASSAVRIEVFRRSRDEFRDIDTCGWDYTMDFSHSEEAVRVAAMQFMGRLDWRPELTGSLWTAARGASLFLGVFENFFRLLVSYRVLDLGGCLLHSAGVADGRSAFVFCGASGAGKTTISRMGLDRGYEVLSDDMNALRPDGGATLVERLPFAGELGQTPMRSSSLPLGGVFRLEKGVENSVEPLDLAQSVALLISCSPYVNADPFRLDTLIGNLTALCAVQPVRRLTFSLDGRFWPLILDAESGGLDGQDLSG